MKPTSSKFIGTPFVLHGRDPESGLDCLGLTLEVLKEYGHDLPDVVLDYERDHPDGSRFEDYLQGVEERLREIHPTEAMPGDVIAFDTHRAGVANHFGVVVSKNFAITTFENSGAMLVNLRVWRSRTQGVYRVHPAH